MLFDGQLGCIKYAVTAADKRMQRGDAKQVIWSLRKKHKDLCCGYGFVVDVDEETVAVPSGWKLPDNTAMASMSLPSILSLPRTRWTAVIGQSSRVSSGRDQKALQGQSVRCSGRLVAGLRPFLSNAGMGTPPKSISAGNLGRPPRYWWATAGLSNH